MLKKRNQTSFKRGHTPWNKGLKGIHLSPATEFKKGNTSLSKLLVGTITQRKCKKNKIRQFIKIMEPNVWKEYAKYQWIKHYGKLLKGDVTHHRDGNILNDKIDNIIALPRTDHPIFHSRWGLKKLSDKQIDFYKSRYLAQGRMF